MLLFIDFCELWWLAWLLPFLLGLLLGWILWAKYRGLWSDSEAKVSSLSGANDKLKSELTTSANIKADLEGDVALMKGRVREMEAKASKLASQIKTKIGGSDVDTSEYEKEIADLKRRLNDCESKNTAPKVSAAPVSNLSAAAPTSTPTPPPAAKSNPYAKLKSDNLQIVEGIGPKMESVLHENGVSSWSALAGKSESDLRAILGKYGDKYRIIDPSSWAAQAALASNADWDGLIKLQKNLDGGRGDTGNNQTDSKLEKLMVKLGYIRKYKENDLKAVEGVGPKIESLLNNGGITTWRGLANTDVSKIQSILDAAGSRFKLADPSTWPKQAEMAADGKWDELQEYQDYLQGGKG